MASAGLCCSSLEDPTALMKMGLSVVLVGHVNFLLGALVHGVILRHINLHKQARAMEYAISNVVAITAGLVGIVVGILAIVLSKNKRSRALMWTFFTFSLAAALMAAAAAIGLFVSVVRAILHGGRSLLTHCRFPDAIGYSSITNECPFDPTRIYSTTLILWVPLIVMCVLQLVFCSRCFSVCVLFLRLPCCPHGKKPIAPGRVIKEVRLEQPGPSHHTEPRGPPPQFQPPPRYQPTPRHKPPLRHQPPSRPQPRPPPQYHHRQHQSLPPAERRPLHQPHRGRPERSAGSDERPAEEHQLLERGPPHRSSFWV
ncbi:transmembrane protein 54b [Genypterus blacodes]|uniref:transmembrane protein 54b n=1 Tax=Genypterus blacodes TaxID=154954 RepID=UPI003F76DE28